MALTGFGNFHQTEAVKGALPTQQNTPQHCPFGLYAEQLSGTAFTKPRHKNLHSWLYRILPSVLGQAYEPYPQKTMPDFVKQLPPIPLRWSPIPEEKTSCDFVDGLFLLAGNKHANFYLYQCQQSMNKRYLANHDGEWLFIPYSGECILHTEFGPLNLAPGAIAVIPRGVKFKMQLKQDYAAGYLCENKANPFNLPELGVIGANGLANPRHFIYPDAACEKDIGKCLIICKYLDNWWQAYIDHSPLNVVAWQGNYAPYTYSLALFNTMNTVSFDHPDPSIFTVLTSESNAPGVANLDFVIFPSRWVVAEHTFRPPYYHRNVMSELMGLIAGTYDAKQEGFVPGGLSIHNQLTSHGPDAASYKKATKQKLRPEYYQETLAFMLEARKPWQVTQAAFNHPARQEDYPACWHGLPPALI